MIELRVMFLFAALFTLFVVLVFFLILDLVHLYRNYLGPEIQCFGLLVEKPPPSFPPLIVLLAGFLFHHGKPRYWARGFPNYAFYLIFEVRGNRRRLLASPTEYDGLQVGKRYKLVCQGERLVSAKRKS